MHIYAHTHLEHKKDNSNHRLFELRIVSKIDDVLFHTRLEVLRNLRRAKEPHDNTPNTQQLTINTKLSLRKLLPVCLVLVIAFVLRKGAKRILVLRPQNVRNPFQQCLERPRLVWRLPTRGIGHR